MCLHRESNTGRPVRAARPLCPQSQYNLLLAKLGTWMNILAARHKSAEQHTCRLRWTVWHTAGTPEIRTHSEASLHRSLLLTNAVHQRHVTPSELPTLQTTHCLTCCYYSNLENAPTSAHFQKGWSTRECNKVEPSSLLPEGHGIVVLTLVNVSFTIVIMTSYWN